MRVKKSYLQSSCTIALMLLVILFTASSKGLAEEQRKYNGLYSGEYLNYAAFPMGGIGAGMVCIEGTGGLSHISVRNKPDMFNEPTVFSAICIKGKSGNIAKVIEGPVPKWKYFGLPSTGKGSRGKTYGLPRFANATFLARFPFAAINLDDPEIPLKVELTGWSPFTPPEANDSSLPVAALEYRFINTSDKPVEAVYSFNAKNFMATGDGNDTILKMENGFILSQAANRGKPWDAGGLAVFVDDPQTKVNCAWLRSGFFEVLTIAWKDVAEGACYEKPPITQGKPSFGATIFVPMKLRPREEKTVKVMLCWYVPETNLRLFGSPNDTLTGPNSPARYQPWYAGRFKNLDEVAVYWKENYSRLRSLSKNFSDCFYDTTVPPEIVEAAAANLTILKSPTILRQTDGRLWCWEGSGDNEGLGYGSCTHVWNYAQATCHLFPELERTFRQTEFYDCQDSTGHQVFRAPLPIRPMKHDFHAASDGQLGGIMKVYRDWRISGDTVWLKKIWPQVKASLNYCIATWDPDHNGVLSEYHHNTYDVEFWGPDGMCGSFYLGALLAADKMADAVGDRQPLYSQLLIKGQKYINEQLFNGEYFYQKIQWKNLHTNNPLKVKNFAVVAEDYSPEAAALIEKEGPRYQYGTGCLADGCAGAWMAWACGLPNVLDDEKIISHLRSIYKYNFKKDLSQYACTQRPAYAIGHEGGVILCTWPKSERPTLPFPSCDEVLTGEEYAVASFMIASGMIKEGLDIVQTCRNRYDGRVRNPFDEYEYGHWYGRAMASYALLQAFTGARYDAVEKVLYLKPATKGDFRSFLSTATGYGTIGIKNGKPFIQIKSGDIPVKQIQLDSPK